MKIIIFGLLIMASLSACNKEVEAITLPPFSIYPNPFTDSFFLTVDPGTPGQSDIRILSGSEKVVAELNNIAPGGSFAVDMRNEEKGIYYIELIVNGEEFIHPVLKAE